MSDAALSRDKAICDALTLSALICKPVDLPDGKRDFEIVHANRAFSENWISRGRKIDFTGARLRADRVIDDETASRMSEDLGKPCSIPAYMLSANLHVRFEPILISTPGYCAYEIIHLSESDEINARRRFLHNIRQLKSNAVLIRVHDDGHFESLYVSPGYAEMMEDTVENMMEMMDGPTWERTTHPDDLPLIQYMRRNGHAPDGGSSIQVRKITAKGHTIWCNAHYAFIEYLKRRYMYITFFDITVLKGYEERLTKVYESISASFYREDEKTLAMFRVDLDRDAVEDARGRAAFPEDMSEKTYTALLQKRAARYPIESEKALLGEMFSPAAISRAYLEGREEVRHIFFTVRENGEICYAELFARTIRHPITGHIFTFLIEKECNDDKVNLITLRSILAHQFDMIAYLANERYSVSVGNPALIGKGSIFPRARAGHYLEYLETQVFPVLSGSEEEKTAMRDSLALERIERELSRGPRYETTIACDIGGETFYKRFVFYIVDPEAKFYILLKQDTTDARREQIARNERLREALEAAEQANAAKTVFLSNMSHDIRTPMNAIIGFTNLARRGDDLARVQEYLAKIDSSSQHLLALINDVLEMSRIESGKMELDEVDADLREIMEDVRDMFMSQMESKRIRYIVDDSGIRNRRVVCDRFRLNRVLLNLLSNAYKFTPEGGRVSVTLFQADGSAEDFGDYELRVRDSGIGMTREFADRVFEAFSRERTSTVSGIQGTGLGMAITKSIVDLMGGTIEVVTAPGEGTEFIVRLRFRLQPDAGRTAEGGSEPDRAGKERSRGDIDFKGMRVLLVEDNAINREIAVLVLTEAGFQVEEAVDGKAALEKVASALPGYYDVVLMDVQMPVMNGYEATRAIRALDDPALAGIPIVAMTANAFSEDRQAALDAGMNGHIAKPLDVSQMLEILAEVLMPEK